MYYLRISIPVTRIGTLPGLSITSMRITIRTELEVRIQVLFCAGSEFLVRGRLIHTPEL